MRRKLAVADKAPPGAGGCARCWVFGAGQGAARMVTPGRRVRGQQWIVPVLIMRTSRERANEGCLSPRLGEATVAPARAFSRPVGEPRPRMVHGYMLPLLKALGQLDANGCGFYPFFIRLGQLDGLSA